MDKALEGNVAAQKLALQSRSKSWTPKTHEQKDYNVSVTVKKFGTGAEKAIEGAAKKVIEAEVIEEEEEFG